MIDRIEILSARLRRLISRNRWSARILGYPPNLEERHEAGLVLIQVDGLGEDVLRRALAAGKMPFLEHLLADERYGLHSMYTGMPSSTPGFQGEFFYGIPTAVPAFGYWDRELGRVLSLNDPTAASAIEKRLLERSKGLLHGGSAWSNIFSGDASEPHLCASTAGLDLLLQALNPIHMLGLMLWYGWSAVRVVANFFVETIVAFYDFLRGTLEGKRFAAELRFIPTRVIVSAGMREIVTAGAAIDTERGLPIVQLNLLGYDEHAHRRGPDSRFALWTLKGIDNSVRRVWLAAHRSKRRDYQVWIYSDHGQEATIAYPLRYGQDVGSAVRQVVARFQEQIDETQGSLGPRDGLQSGAERSSWLQLDLPWWLRFLSTTRGGKRTDTPDADASPVVVHQGPVGFVYLHNEPDDEERRELARRVAREANIPFVLIRQGENGALAFSATGQEFQLPLGAAMLFGQDHPYLDEVCRDTLSIVHHPDAGPLVLLGWTPGQPHSLQLEHGAHGGPGPRETSAFALLPPEVTAPNVTLRPAVLRAMALRVLQGVITAEPTDPGPVTAAVPKAPAQEPSQTGVAFRLVCYNVHGCRGMDGKFSPQRIARVISGLEPDVICLQELDQSRTRSGGIDQVHAIANSLRVDYHFHAVAEIDDGRFGNAVLSPHPLRNIASGPLPALRTLPGLEVRGVLWVTVAFPGCDVHVINTHLSILEQERRLQVDALMAPDWVGGLDEMPAVFCGDLNAAPDSYTCRRLGEQLRSVDNGRHRRSALNTWSSRIPMRRIDHVFVTDAVQVREVHVPRTRLTRVASDHLPLVVDLSYPVPEAVEPPRRDVPVG